MVDKSSIKKFYNNVYKKGDIRDDTRLYRLIVALINPLPFTRLLDVGCGIGCLLYEAVKRNISVFGLDISSEALAKLRTILSPANVCVADGEKIPFKDASFEYVISLGSIEHFLHLEEGIREIKRVLKSNGLAILLLPNSFYFGDILKVLFTGKSDEQWQIQEKLLTKEQWRLLVEGNGLAVKKIYKYNKYPQFFQEGTFKIKSVRKYIKTFLMKNFCPLNLAWQFVFVCSKAGG
jgi:ubiquinone/menaquinone biosynthesis C-methylase UbiE